MVRLLTAILIAVSVSAFPQSIILNRRQAGRSAYLTPPTSCLDNFDGPDVSPMRSTMSGSTGTWTVGPGTMDAPQNLVDNLYGGAGTENGCRVLSPVFTNNQSASITMNADLACGVMVRIQGTADASGYMANLLDSTHLVFWKVSDSMGAFNYTGLATSTIPAVVQFDVITLNATGTTTTTLEAFLNGVSVGSTSDSSSPYNGGQPGIYFFGFSGSCIQFSATDL